MFPREQTWSRKFIPKVCGHAGPNLSGKGALLSYEEMALWPLSWGRSRCLPASPARTRSLLNILTWRSNSLVPRLSSEL